MFPQQGGEPCQCLMRNEVFFSSQTASSAISCFFSGGIFSRKRSLLRVAQKWSWKSHRFACFDWSPPRFRPLHSKLLSDGQSSGSPPTPLIFPFYPLWKKNPPSHALLLPQIEWEVRQSTAICPIKKEFPPPPSLGAESDPINFRDSSSSSSSSIPFLLLLRR